MNRKCFAMSGLSAVALATILACGAMIAWMVVVVWSTSVVDHLFFLTPPGESLAFTTDGRALLQSYHAGNYPDWTYRTLDGQPVEPSAVKLQTDNASLPRPEGRDPSELSWDQRVVGFAQVRDRPALWYLLHDGQPRGHAYFAGFDPKSKRAIGNLGLHGIRPDRPPPDEQLAIRSQLMFGGAYAGQWSSRGTEPHATSEAVPAVFVVSQETLYRFDLERQSVRAIRLPDKVLSVSNLNEPVAVEDEREVTYKQRIAVRLPEQLVLMSLEGENLRSIPLPREIRDDGLSIFGTTGRDSIVVVNRFPLRSPTEIYWIGAQGDVARHETVRLGTGASEDRRLAIWLVTAVLPAPGIQTLGVLTLLPWDEMTKTNSSDYTSAVVRSLPDAWPPLLTIFALSAILAVLCFRHHRRYNKAGGYGWAVFVLVLGVPGLVGYWLHRRWPVSERCAQCDAMAPRDRESCLHCAAEFAAPALTGIEVFA